MRTTDISLACDHGRFRQRMMPSDSVPQARPRGHLGRLEQLPQELLEQVLRQLPHEDARAFRTMSGRAFDIVTLKMPDLWASQVLHCALMPGTKTKWRTAQFYVRRTSTLVIAPMANFMLRLPSIYGRPAHEAWRLSRRYMACQGAALAALLAEATNIKHLSIAHEGLLFREEGAPALSWTLPASLETLELNYNRCNPSDPKDLQTTYLFNPYFRHFSQRHPLVHNRTILSNQNLPSLQHLAIDYNSNTPTNLYHHDLFLRPCAEPLFEFCVSSLQLSDWLPTTSRENLFTSNFRHVRTLQWHLDYRYEEGIVLPEDLEAITQLDMPLLEELALECTGFEDDRQVSVLLQAKWPHLRKLDLYLSDAENHVAGDSYFYASSLTQIVAYFDKLVDIRFDNFHVGQDLFAVLAGPRAKPLAALHFDGLLEPLTFFDTAIFEDFCSASYRDIHEFFINNIELSRLFSQALPIYQHRLPRPIGDYFRDALDNVPAG